MGQSLITHYFTGNTMATTVNIKSNLTALSDLSDGTIFRKYNDKDFFMKMKANPNIKMQSDEPRTPCCNLKTFEIHNIKLSNLVVVSNTEINIGE